MPNALVSDEKRTQRQEALRPLAEYMARRGIMRRWLARQLGISDARISAYFLGHNRAPEWFLSRAWQVIANPRELPPPARRRRLTKARDSPHHAA